MKYIKTQFDGEYQFCPYEVKLYNIYPELFTNIRSDIYPPYYRYTSFQRLKSIKNFPFFKEFIDEILLNKYIEIYSTDNKVKFIVEKCMEYDPTHIIFYYKNDKKFITHELIRFKIGYDEYPKIGPIEKEAIEYLNIIIDAKKYNL
jgi:hypothetical protein